MCPQMKTKRSFFGYYYYYNTSFLIVFKEYGYGTKGQYYCHAYSDGGRRKKEFANQVRNVLARQKEFH
jgi:hypothetical protein